MAGSLNRVELIGHLGADPEVRNNPDNTRRVLMSLATSKRWTDRESGEKRQSTEWHRVVIWNTRLVDIASQYLHKGALLYVDGELRTRKWQDSEGKDRWTSEVVLPAYGGELVMLDSKREGEGGDGHDGAADRTNGKRDEEVPF